MPRVITLFAAWTGVLCMGVAMEAKGIAALPKVVPRGGLVQCQDELATCENAQADIQGELAQCQGEFGTCEGNLVTCNTGLSDTQQDLADCSVDLSACNTELGTCLAAPVCGNSVVETGEDCEVGQPILGTCAEQGFLGGNLTCGTGCTLDTSACYTQRFVIDPGGRTVRDNEKHLMWERKTTDGSVHDVSRLYSWTTLEDEDPTNPDGTVFTVFLQTLNHTCRDDENVACVGNADCAVANGGPGGPCGFAGYSNWRLPEVDRDGGTPELETILLPGAPDSCPPGPIPIPCIDEAIFGPSERDYWSAVTSRNENDFAWFLDFAGGVMRLGNGKPASLRSRAVRTVP